VATGDHDWTTGEVVTAANVDDYLQLQTVQQYADATARNTALTSRKRENMVTAQADTNTLTVYSGSAWSTVGPVHGALTTFTPSVAQSNTPTQTVVRAVYTRTGRWVEGYAHVTIGAAGTAANNVIVQLPVAADLGTVEFTPIGSAYIRTSAGLMYFAELNVGAGTSEALFVIRSQGVSVTYLGTTTFTAALASGDKVSYRFGYVAAADA
jgi:hypothetical protein